MNVGLSLAASRRYLRLIRSADDHRGPLFLFHDQRKYERARSALLAAIQDIDWIDAQTWWAPTPWHAAAWLLNIAGGLVEAKEILPAPLRLRPLLPRTGLLFRGQRDMSWPIRPRISRTASPTAARTAMLRLALALEVGSLLTEAVSVERESHFAVAQHHGIPTHLLDMTVDPRIAVFFGCDGGADGDVAAVHWIDFDSAMELGLRLIVAPPWVERIHRQLGVFLDTEAAGANDLDRHFRRIVFPIDHRYVHNEFGSRDALYGGDLWFDRAARWAENTSIAPVEAAAEGLWKSLLNTVGNPQFEVMSLDSRLMAKQFDLLITLIDWMALRQEGDVFRADCRPIVRLAHDNSSLFVWMLRTAKTIVKAIGSDIKPTPMTLYFIRIVACLDQDRTW